MNRGAANDDWPAFEHFMLGYWNQMAPDLYPDFESALADYRKTEGEGRFDALKRELVCLHEKQVFPALETIRQAYDQPFWSRFGMIVTEEDVGACAAIFGDRQTNS